MNKFYEGCLFCAFQEQSSCERCFECAEVWALKEKWIHSLGFYYPRKIKEHRDSKWSKAILIAKRNFKILSVFGRITAFYLNELEYLKPYTLTYVPEFQDDCWFNGFNMARMEVLSNIIFSRLQDKRGVTIERILVQVNKKRKKQRYCSTDKERFKNVNGAYLVLNPERIAGKNVVLIDDVLTSGATLKECSDLLVNAGTRNVTGLVLAKTFRGGN